MEKRTIKIVIDGSEMVVDKIIQINDYEIIAYNFTKDDNGIKITYAILLHKPQVHFNPTTKDITINAEWGTRSKGLDDAALKLAIYMDDMDVNADSMAITPEDFKSENVEENEENGE